MEILTEAELATRLDFRRPLNPEPEPKESVWCIPFEYGANAKGTRISVALAKTIAAELRAAVAEAEKRELRRALDDERKRSESLGAQLCEANDAKYSALSAVAELEAKARRRKKKLGARPA